MDKLTTDVLQKMLNEEREKLLIEVKEKAEQRKKLMQSEQVSDYNFFKRRNSISK